MSKPGEGRELPRLPVDRVAASLPPRFAGPLPSDIDGFHQELEKGPPLSYVRSRLLEGDPEMEAKFLSALRQTADSAWNFEELWGTYGVVLGVSDHRDAKPSDDMYFLEGLHNEGVPCAWLRARLADAPEENPLLAELLWRKLVRCPGPEATTLFARQDAPIPWALDHHSLFNARRFTPTLERAVRRILGQNREDLFSRARAYLSSYQEPVALELRDELWRRASDEQRAEWEQKDASAELERRREAEHPWKCPSIPTRPDGLDDQLVRQCVDEWAASNWAAASRLAMSAFRSPKLVEATEPLATLRNFPSAAAMKAWARERKLLPEVAPVPEAKKESLYLFTLMRQEQRAFSVDLGSQVVPRRHDELLVTLAWIARPALAGVVFEQLPPKSPPPDFFQPPATEHYTLRAYADGQRFSVEALNTRSLADIGAVLGLLNQVLEARGSAARFAVLDTQASKVTVVFGPEAALREADGRGLWRLGDGREVLVQAEAMRLLNIRRILGEIPF